MSKGGMKWGQRRARNSAVALDRNKIRGMEDAKQVRETFHEKENRQMRMIEGEMKNRGGGKEMTICRDKERATV